MTDLRVSELWRFPVKSLGGEQLQAEEVNELGLLGDRVRGLLDLETGHVLTARRAPDLLFASARYEAGEVIITLPDGTETADDAALSSWLGKDVSLVATGDEGATYENPMDAENDADWISWQGPQDSFHDSGKSKISLLSTGSFGEWNHLRFRSNVILEGSGEDALVGSNVQIGGSTTLAVQKKIGRCVMVTRPQPGLDRDLDVLRTVNKANGGDLSVGALITTPGPIAVGDNLTAS